MARTRKITDDPANLAYHIIRSVAHDSYTVHDDVLLLRYGNELMTCECPADGGDVTVSVKEISGGEWRTTYANDTGTIDRMWSR